MCHCFDSNSIEEEVLALRTDELTVSRRLMLKVNRELRAVLIRRVGHKRIEVESLP